MNIEALARPDILALSPYVSARSGAAADGVLLNANEAPASLLDGPPWAGLHLNRYPVPQPQALRDRLAALYRVSPDELLITRGSDEGIDLLVRVFCRAGEDAVLESPPCFGMYRIAAAIQGAGVIAVPRRAATLTLDIGVLERRIRATQNLKLVFLTSPNNPTGDRLSRADLLRLLDACAGRCLLVLDEAYIEFCRARSAAELVGTHPQLVVLRTLSKAFAAAGLRCGSVLADPRVIGLLQRVMAPYPLSSPAVAAALAVTDESARGRQRELLAALDGQKARLLDFLKVYEWLVGVWPGEANFVLVKVDDGPGLVRFCAARGVRVRDFSDQPMLEDCVRLTVGAPREMDQLEAALTAWGDTR